MSHACTTLAEPQTEAAEAAFRYSGEEREEEWRRSLLSLQEWICELLIENQELRMLLPGSASLHQSEEAD